MQTVHTPSGASNFVYFWVAPVPQPTVDDVWSSMCEELDEFLGEPDKHTAAAFRPAAEVLTAVREGTSDTYARGAEIALGLDAHQD